MPDIRPNGLLHSDDGYIIAAGYPELRSLNLDFSQLPSNPAPTAFTSALKSFWQVTPFLETLLAAPLGEWIGTDG
jgi:hypothetical protein